MRIAGPWALVGLLLAAMLSCARADTPILTVRGKIGASGGPEIVTFDRQGLAGFRQHSIRTKTVWTDGVHTFRGVLLCDLLDAVDAYGDTVEARALNDYFVEIPIEDCRRYPVLLATEQDGERLTVRSRGPIWIIYPRDDFDELHNSLMDARWVWQLQELIVR